MEEKCRAGHDTLSLATSAWQACSLGEKSSHWQAALEHDAAWLSACSRRNKVRNVNAQCESKRCLNAPAHDHHSDSTWRWSRTWLQHNTGRHTNVLNTLGLSKVGIVDRQHGLACDTTDTNWERYVSTWCDSVHLYSLEHWCVHVHGQ